MFYSCFIMGFLNRDKKSWKKAKSVIWALWMTMAQNWVILKHRLFIWKQPKNVFRFANILNNFFVSVKSISSIISAAFSYFNSSIAASLMWTSASLMLYLVKIMRLINTKVYLNLVLKYTTLKFRLFAWKLLLFSSFLSGDSLSKSGF